jgi:CheY-like chemotaxis protein
MPSAHRILVVENEYVLAQNVKTYLSRRCPDVRIAADGRSAIEMVASFSPDVVVLDYGLPWKNGLQFYREMVRRGAPLPGCVMITGYPLENLTPPASRLGIHYLLCKPFSLADLQQLIDRSADEASRVWH